MLENPAFLREQLMTYLGNKRRLLPFIGEAVGLVQGRLGRRGLSILDLFSGTGIVARYCKQFATRLVVNDLEPYSRVTNACYLSNADAGLCRELAEALEGLEADIAQGVPGFIARLYAPRDDGDIQWGERVFYTRRNAEYLDSARQAIGRLPEGAQKYFLGPLLAQASVHANTSGVFKGFYKGGDGRGQFGGQGRNALMRITRDIQVCLPVFSRFDCEVEVYAEDANAFVRRQGRTGSFDLAYFDPPYNEHPYGSNYFMLNLLVDYEEPESLSLVSGIPRAWRRSAYNRRAEAAGALFDAVEHCNARFILISYSSEGIIEQRDFLEKLGRLGRMTVLETPYATFRASRNLAARALHVTEFLYLLEKE